MKKKFLITFFVSFLCFTLLYSTILKPLFEKKPTVTIPNVIDNENIEKEKEDGLKVKNEILFLLMGVDAEDVKKSKGTRTDTMMLMKVNFDTGGISLLSIPRDTRVLVDGKLDKINHAHQNGGVELALNTVREFLGIDLEYYVKVDYKIVVDVVDAIGGVKINVPFDMKYKEYNPKVPPLNIDIKKGEQILDGKNSHDFLRWRNNNAKTVGYKEGDIGRIKAQQYFMKELAKQTLKPKNLLRLPSLIETYFENVETNIPISIMLKGAISANKIDVENMVTNTIPGEGKYIGEISYFVYDKEKMEVMVKDMFGSYIK